MAKKATQPEVLDMVVADEDLRTVQTDGGTILEFLKGLGAFFVRAKALEDAALATRDAAKAIKAPTTAAEDGIIQRFIQKTTADKKEIESAWEICALVHRFHRKLTARRDVGVKALDEANAIGNRLHNAYTAEARRKAEQLEREAREREEFLARQEREQELARLEQDAIEREASTPDLSEREQRFVELVAFGLNTPQTAARVAGYADPVKSALRLSALPKVLAAIKAMQDAQAIRRQAEALAAAPVHVQVEEVKPNIIRAGGSYDRTTESGEVIDVDALRQAYLSGKYGLPADLMEPVQRIVNELARSMGPRLNTIPGLRYKSTTKVV